MATLTSSYQYIGRSNAVFNYGSTYYYYLLLYAKTEGNTSTGKHKVSLKMRIACQAGDGFYGYSTTGYAKVAGTSAINWSAQQVPNGAWTTGSLTEGGVTYNRWVDLKEGNAEVDTGFGSTKNVTLEASFQRLDMASPPNHVPQTTPMTISATVTLPALAGASVPTVSASSVAMGSAVTITTNRKSDSFTHDLTYSFGSASDTIASNVGASYSWTVPDLVAKIPNALSGTCTITCKTKNGSAVIGTSTCTLTLTVPAKSKPSASATSAKMGGSVVLYTNSKSTAYTHTFSYSINGSTGTIATGIKTDKTWSIPDLVAKIPNALNGTCTISCTTYNGTAAVGTDTCTITLTVPDASTPTLSATTLAMGGSMTITTNRKSTGFTHKVRYVFGSANGDIKTGVTDSCTWSPPLDLANQIPNAATGYGVIICYTYNGTKEVGAVQINIKLTVPDNASTKPAVSMTLSPNSTLGATFSGLYIQNLTKLTATVTASGKYGATISQKAVSVGGSAYSGGVLTQTGSVSVVGSAKDSRGFLGTTSQSINIIPYSKPTIVPASGKSDIVCARCDKNGSLTASGTYLRIIAQRSYSTITASGVQKNFCYIRYRVNGGSWVTILAKNAASNEVDTGAISGVNLALTSAYTVDVGVVDDIGNTHTVTKAISTDKVDVHLREGGGGFALGKYSGEAGFECAMDAYFSGQTYRVADDGAKEWFFPPMEPGAIYRTAERFLGKPVYTTCVYFDKLPNADAVSADNPRADIGLVILHNTFSERVISISGVYSSFERYTGNGYDNIVYNNEYELTSGNYGIKSVLVARRENATHFQITTDKDMSNYSAYITIKFIR